MKIAHILPAVLLVAGCHEFEGELGQLGFISNLIIQPGQDWTPDNAIATETSVTVFASAFLTRESDQAPQVEASLSSSLIELDSEEGHIAFTGDAGDNGRVMFWGEATDRFSVRFHDPAEMVLYVPGRDEPTLEMVVMKGAEVLLHPEIVDAWDEPLGWSPALLEVDGCQASRSDSGVLLLKASAPCTITADLDGLPLLEQPVAVVSEADVVSLTLTAEIIEDDNDERLIVHARGWTEDGVEVLGIHPEWSTTSDTELWSQGSIAAISLDEAASDTVFAALGDREWSISAD